MALTIADAEVKVTADGKPAAKQVVDDFEGESGSAGRAGDSVGKSLFKGILGAWAVIGGARIVSGFFSAGFERLESIDNARAKLTGLGHDALIVDGIMDDALASVRGTAFGLGSAATVAASAVASGITPGMNLQRTLRLVADTATIAGGSMEELGSIYNKVAASNRLSTEEVNQLLDRGIPVLQALSAQLGVTQDEVRELVTKGKVDFETFQAAMEGALGGAAQSGGETFSGAMANVRAALSRVSAGLLEGVFPMLVPLLQGIQAALGPIEDGASGIGAAFADRVRPAFEWVGTWMANLDLARIGAWFDSFSVGSKIIRDLLSPAFAVLRDVLRDEILPRLGDLSSWFEANGELIGAIATGVGVMAAAWGLAAGGVYLFTGALSALKVALLSHPIGWVLLVIGGIVGGLIWLEDTTHVFSNTWETVMGTLAPIFRDVWDELRPAIEELAAAWDEVLLALDPVFKLLGFAFDWLKDNWVEGVRVIVRWLSDELLPVVIDVLVNRVVPAIIDFATMVAWVVNNIVVPAVRFLGDYFTWLWNDVIQPFVEWASPGMERFGTAVSWAFTEVILPVLELAGRGFALMGAGAAWVFTNVIVPAIGLAVTGFGVMWSIVAPILDNLVRGLQLMGAGVSWVITNVVLPVLDLAGRGFSLMGAGASWVISNIILPVLGNMGAGFSLMWAGVSVIFDLLVRGFGRIGDAAAGVAGRVSAGFATMAGVVRVALNGVIGLANGAIRAINGLSITIPAFVPVVGGSSFSPNIPTIPMLARGTNNAPDAFIAGEAGPELITGARGATVTPYSATRDRFAETQEPRTVTVIFQAGAIVTSDPEAAADEVARKIERKLGV